MASGKIMVIRAFFDGTVSAVRHDGELSSRTGQGNLPPIFNVCLNWAAQFSTRVET